MAGGQVLGGRLVAEPAEVDHPRDAGLFRQPREARRGSALDRGVVLVVADHVDEEVGDVDTLEGVGDPGRAREVGDTQVAAEVLELGGALGLRVANDAADVEAVLDELLAELAADEPGGAGDEDG